MTAHSDSSPAILAEPRPGTTASTAAAILAADVEAYAATALEAVRLMLPAPVDTDAAAVAALDEMVTAQVATLSGELTAVGGHDRLVLMGPLAVLAEPGLPGLRLAGGATPTVARLLTDALNADPVFADVFARCESLARILVLGRAALQATQTLAASPGQAEVLWEWLCERSEHVRCATFRLTMVRGQGGASLTDDAGRPLGRWTARPAGPVLVAAE